MRPWLFWEQEPLNRPAADDVLLHDFVDVSFGDVGVPDVVRIDHDVRALLALIEAAGLVCAHPPRQAVLGERLLEGLVQGAATVGIAAAARMSGRPLVGAHEEMPFEGCHG